MVRLLDGAECTFGHARWAEPLLGLIPSLGLILLLSACGATINWDYPRTGSTALSEPQTTTIGALFQEASGRHPGQFGFSFASQGERAFIDRLAMADLDEGVSHGSAYHVTLDQEGDLVWTAETNGTNVAFDSDPKTGLWQRLKIDLSWASCRLKKSSNACASDPHRQRASPLRTAVRFVCRVSQATSSTTGLWRSESGSSRWWTFLS